jgi:hypothetical protein
MIEAAMENGFESFEKKKPCGQTDRRHADPREYRHDDVADPTRPEGSPISWGIIMMCAADPSC